jgi:integrase
MLVGQVTPERGRAYYDAFRSRPRPDGKPISVDYQRDTLINARSFLAWCVEQGFAPVNVLASVKGVGRRNAGKQQHTGDEARRLYSLCIDRARAGDHSALGVLMALTMALRSGDLYRRQVRDLDLDASVLRISHGKTGKSNRPRRVPEVLRPMLREMAKGRAATAPLFWTPYTEDGYHTHKWLWESMARFCKLAGVPRVCPHSLKGAAGNILADTGAAAEVIADHLSHEKTETTMRHYVEAGRVEEEKAARGLRLIAGGAA